MPRDAALASSHEIAFVSEIELNVQKEKMVHHLK
jgi:hypothetical protein